MKNWVAFIGKVEEEFVQSAVPNPAVGFGSRVFGNCRRSLLRHLDSLKRLLIWIALEYLERESYRYRPVAVGHGEWREAGRGEEMEKDLVRGWSGGGELSSERKKRKGRERKGNKWQRLKNRVMMWDGDGLNKRARRGGTMDNLKRENTPWGQQVLKFSTHPQVAGHTQNRWVL
jgi:hypothetical protein